MIWPIVFVTTPLAIGLVFIVREARMIVEAECTARRAEALCRQTESNNQRAAAERLHDQVKRFYDLTGAHRSDNLQPVTTPPARPNFGLKLHVIDGDRDGGAEA